jgi:hypothetical protein
VGAEAPEESISLSVSKNMCKCGASAGEQSADLTEEIPDFFSSYNPKHNCCNFLLGYS